MLSLLIMGFFFGTPKANALEVSLLTPQGQKVLKTWSGVQLQSMAKRSLVSAQNLIFETSAQDLDLNVRADIDLVTLYGAKNRIARVPRYMIWRGSLKFFLNSDGTLRSQAGSFPPMVPKDFFSVDEIYKIELSRASVLYPGTKLSVRTNPAATRGEKLFTQSCMACHSLSNTPKLEVPRLSEAYLVGFQGKHKPTGKMGIDPRALRGLLAYREALASEKNSVSSAK